MTNPRVRVALAALVIGAGLAGVGVNGLAPATSGASAVAARIIACHDGDTCTVDRAVLPGRDRVRLADADAPELAARCPAERDQAERARAFSAAFVGQVVALSAIKPDKYARRFDALVRLPDGRDLGAALITAGLARPYAGGPRAGWCG